MEGLGAALGLVRASESSGLHGHGLAPLTHARISRSGLRARGRGRVCDGGSFRMKVSARAKGRG